MSLRNKQLIVSIVIITIGTMNIKGCSKFKDEKEPIIVSENVQKMLILVC